MSSETSIREGLCVYCGTARPVTKPICPQCGRTWIDTKIGEDLPALTPEIVAASKEEREALAAAEAAAEQASAATHRPRGLLVGALVGVIAIVVIFIAASGGDDGEQPVAGSTPTTTQAPTTEAPGTTAGDTTDTTTAPTTSSTTSTSTTTTTTTTTTIPPIEPEGAAVPLEELTLGAFALGPFRFDTGAYLGRLVASLGQPDTKTEADTDLGLCPDEQGTAYTWGALMAIFRLEGEEEILVGYRLDDTGTDHPTQQIATRSGLQLGDTIERLDAIYLQSGLALEEVDGTPTFLLLRSSDDATLLWGPVSGSSAADVVEGIYSPRACDSGPVPSV